MTTLPLLASPLVSSDASPQGDYVSAPVKAVDYNKTMYAIQTCVFSVDNFSGNIEIQGTLVKDPSDNDWFSAYLMPQHGERLYRPSSIIWGSTNTSRVFTDIPVIIDGNTRELSLTLDLGLRVGYVPARYSPVLDSNGVMTGVNIVDPGHYNHYDFWSAANADNMYVLPQGTLLDYDSLKTAILNSSVPYGTLDTALVISELAPLVQSLGFSTTVAGNFVWLRAVISNFTAGTINHINITY